MQCKIQHRNAIHYLMWWDSKIAFAYMIHVNALSYMTQQCIIHDITLQYIINVTHHNNTLYMTYYAIHCNKINVLHNMYVCNVLHCNTLAVQCTVIHDTTMQYIINVIQYHTWHNIAIHYHTLLNVMTIHWDPWQDNAIHCISVLHCTTLSDIFPFQFHWLDRWHKNALYIFRK